MPTNYLKPTDEHFAQKLVDALNIGLREMAEKAAENNESLAIGYLDGTSASIPAKELSKQFPEKGR
nr:hypothetical protein [uncultured Mucilaginibacter sp.]